MSKPPPSFWLDPEGDGVEVEPPVEPESDHTPDAERETDAVPDDVAPDDTPADRGASAPDADDPERER